MARKIEKKIVKKIVKKVVPNVRVPEVKKNIPNFPSKTTGIVNPDNIIKADK